MTFWQAAAVLAACLVGPGVWGWASRWVFHRLPLERWFPPCLPGEDPLAGKPEPTQTWNYDI